MTTLVSPGVDVSIIDESYYSSAGVGTVPLIVFASAANKPSPTGTGVAPYSVPSQAGKLFLATSQRELIQNFGIPTFHSVQGTAIHGHELNEYGLFTAYDFLGMSNRAFVMRADIDLAQLEPSVDSPRGLPTVGTHWLDLNDTGFGIFQSNGNPSAGLAWVVQPTIAAGDGMVDMIDESRDAPAQGIGTEGDFAVVVTLSDNLIFEKVDGEWFQIGSPEWKAKRQTVIMGTVATPTVLPTDQMSINGNVINFSEVGGTPTVEPLNLANIVARINELSSAPDSPIANIVAAPQNDRLVLRNLTGGDINLAIAGSEDALAKLGIVSKNGVRVYYTSDAQYPQNSVAGDVWVKGTVPNRGADWVVKVWDAAGRWVRLAAPFYPFNSLMADGNATKDEAATIAIGNPSVGQIYVGYDSATGAQQLRRWAGTRWENLIYEAGTVPPMTSPEAGVLWYNADLRADIMVGDGTQWLGYRRRYPDTDPAGVLISGSRPMHQSDGTPLVDNDLWIDSSDEENYPMIYRYSAATQRWAIVDKADQTTPFGIVFRDARDNSGPIYSGAPNAYTFNSTELADMALSNYVDPDAPDARAYPADVMLFNTRFSTGNVKEWRPDHFREGNYDANVDFTMETYRVGNGSVVFPPVSSAGRWVTASGNTADGSPYMLRKAQRAMVVRSLASMLSSNEDLRSELIYFNLIAAPGYPELLDEMVLLNTDQKEVAFIVGDTPARLKPSGYDVMSWANNAKMAVSSGEDGLTLANPYVGLYYPWGLMTDSSGMEVMVPPSTIALRTIAYSDSVSYPWFAPAGFQRGLVKNATSVGYLTEENEFRPVILSDGQQQNLYLNKINPFVFIPNRGLVVNGQKTLNPLTTALDRINVARLVNHIKYQLDIVVKPFLFEQNDAQTRDSARITVERFFNALVGQRGLEDYAVLCDESNNTPERRARNELWIDVAIKPIAAVEFIYVPVRVLHQAADLPVSTF